MEQIPKIEQEQVLENYFEKADIVVLAENFHGTHDEEIICVLDKHSDQIRGLFLELSVSYQSSVDLYMEKGEIDQSLERYFLGAQKESKDIRGILKMLDKLKELGKPVICIDSSKVAIDEYKTKSEHGYYFLRGESRDEDMSDNINNYYQENPGKYFVIVGGAHVEDGKHFRTGKDTLGTRLKNNLEEKYLTVYLKSKE
ncbi:MAG: hypothetical protein WC095_00560 [Candidatus Paceibacterota bacterium]